MDKQDSQQAGRARRVSSEAGARAFLGASAAGGIGFATQWLSNSAWLGAGSVLLAAACFALWFVALGKPDPGPYPGGDTSTVFLAEWWRRFRA